MPPAEEDEVPEAGLSPASPVLDVVRIDEAPVLAAGEAAAAVAPLQRSAHGRRDRARLAPYRERFPGSFTHFDHRGVAGEPPRGLRRERRPLRQLTAASFLARERALVHVHDNLMPLSARALRAREREIGHRRERIGLRRPRFRGTAFAQLRMSTLEGLHEHGTVLGREPASQDKRAVFVPVPVEIGALLDRDGLLGRHAPVSPDRPLELGRGHVPRELQQSVLVLSLCDPAQRAHLGEGELALGERGSDRRQFSQPSRDPHMFARGSRRQPAAPGEPLRGRAANERVPPVELGHQLEPAAGSRVDVRRQARELVLELTEREVGEATGLSLDNVHVGKIANEPDGIPPPLGHYSVRSRPQDRPSGQ